MLDLIAAEYGWTLEETLRLTVGQANALLSALGDRKKKEAMNQALVFRLAIASILSKEGAEMFQQSMNEIYQEPVRAMTPKDLAKVGLGAR